MEMQTLNEFVKAKIDRHIKSITDTSDDYKSKYERIRVNSEQQNVELEKQLVYTKSKLLTEADQRSSTEKKFAQLDAKYKDLMTKLRQVEENKEDTDAAQMRATKSNELLEADKQELSLLVDRKNKEIQALHAESAGLSEKVNEANNLRCEAQSKLDEVQAHELALQYKEKRFEQEKKQLEGQVAWFTSELHNKCDELVNLRKQKAGQNLKTEVELSETKQQNEILRESVESLQTANQEKETKIDDLIARLKESRESHLQIDEHYRNELTSQRKLADLYKDLAAQGDSQINEYTSAIEELQRLYKESQQAVSVIENEKATLVNDYTTQLESRDGVISNMKTELKNANDLIVALKLSGGVDVTKDGMEDLCPTAAATSRILKSGMTLTEIYSEYVQVAGSLELEKDENKRLNSYLDQILQEIEEKAPILKKQREDYEASLDTITNMTNQLNTALLDREKLQLDADESRRLTAHNERERQKLNQQTIDLSQQVRFLVKEVEELRGGRVIIEEMDESSSEVSSSSQVITQKLVTFRNIKELQEKNQNLLEVVRDLSDKKERDEQEASDSRIQGLKEQVDKLLEEVDELNSVRRRQAEMVESVVRQRDMYRVLLSQSSDGTHQIPGPSLTSTPIQAPAPAPTPPTHKSPPTDTDITLQETKTALAEYKAKYETFRTEKNENEKLLNEQLNTIRDELNRFRIQNTKLTSELEFSNERYKVLQGNVTAYKKETDIQRDKSLKYSASILKHEQTISAMKEDLMVVQQERNQLEVQIQQYKLERDLAKRGEARLVQEREALGREHKAQNMMLANLQAIKNNMERGDFEKKTKLTNQVERLEGELSSLNRRLGSEQEQHQAAIRNFKSQLVEVRGECEKEVQKRQDALKQLVLSEANQQDLKQEMSNLESKLMSAEMQLTKLKGICDIGDNNMTKEETRKDEIAVNNEENLKDIQMRLEASQTEALALRNQTNRLKDQIEQYKNVAMSVEKSLTDQNQASKVFKESLQKQMEELNQSKESMSKRMAELEKEKLQLIGVNTRELEKLSTQNGELRTQLTQTQTQLQETIEKYERAAVIETAARADTQAQADIASEAQEKYEKEMMLHLADVEALADVKAQMSIHNSKLQAAEQEATMAKAKLFKAQASWEENRRVLLEEKQKLDKRCEEVTAQNATLHEQMEKLTSDVVEMQEKAMLATPAETGHNVSVTDDTTKSSQQLLQVIKFLRKERQICETKLDVIQSESGRVKQKCEYLEKRLEEADRQLTEERNLSQVNVQTAAQHAELMRKVENVTLLSDSNKLLREEKNMLTQSLKESEIKVKKYEDELSPLRDEVRDLRARTESFTAQTSSLQGETERWRVRTNQLIEQTNKTDPDENKRLLKEREQLRRQLTTQNNDIQRHIVERDTLQRKTTALNDDIKKLNLEKDQVKKSNSSMTEEINKHKTDINKLSTDLQSKQSEVTATKQEVTKLKEELQTLQTEISKKAEESEEKIKTINQLKKVGRKYKEQAENVGQELEALRKEVTELRQKSTTSETTATQEADRLTESLKTNEDMLKQLEESKVKLTEAEAKLQTGENQRNDLQALLDAQLKELEENKNKLMKLTSETTELEKKQEISRKILQNARSKITTQKDDLEKVRLENAAKEKENNTLKQTNKEISMRLKASTSQLEEKTKELKTTSASSSGSSPDTLNLRKLQAENLDLALKVTQLQKLLEKQKPVVTRSPVVAPVERSSMSGASSDPPRMANIRPMTTPSVSVRHSAPVQPVTTSVLSTKATASIRPMAITPTAVPTSAPLPLVSLPSATPTATVMPTTAMAQEAHDVTTATTTTTVLTVSISTTASTPVAPVTSPSIPSVATTSRPTQQIQRVAPQVDHSSPPTDILPPTTRDDTQPLEPMRMDTSTTTISSVAPVFTLATTLASTSTSITPTSSFTPTTSTPVVSLTTTPSSVTPSTSITSVSSTSQLTQSTSQPLQTTAKRTRDSDSASEIEQETPQVKKTKTTENIVVPQIVVTEPSTQPSAVTTSAPPPQQQVIEDTAHSPAPYTSPVASPVIETPSQNIDTPESSEDGDSDVIVLSDDEGGIAETVAEDYEEDDDDDDDDDDDGEDESDEYFDGMDVGQEQMAEGDEDETEDVDDENEDGMQAIADDGGSDITAHTDTGTESQTISPASSQQTVPPTLTRQSLTPFTLSTQTSQFEDGDDCTVPSTPTLCVPRRTDGFAEAVSSPQVTQTFEFGGASGETQTDLIPLSSQSIGDDDLVLTQYDDIGGVTSLSRSTPQDTAQYDAFLPVDMSANASQPPATETESNDLDLEGDLGDEDDSEETAVDAPLDVLVPQDTERADTVHDGTDTSSIAAGDGTPTSDDTQSSASSIPTSDPGGALSRPRIQRIIWDETTPDTQSPPNILDTILPDTTNTLPIISTRARARRSRPHLMRGAPMDRGRGIPTIISNTVRARYPPLRGSGPFMRARGPPRGRGPMF